MSRCNRGWLRYWPEIIVGTVSVIMLVMAIQIYFIRHPGEPKVSRVVTDLLDEIIREDYNASSAIYIFPKYFTSLEGQMPPPKSALMDYYSVEQDLFEQVVYKYTVGYKGYEVEAVTDEYVEISLINFDGSYDYPKVGLWYTIKGGKIDTWRLARLLPFSRYDEEYSEDWDGR